MELSSAGPEQRLEELADLREVLTAITATLNFSEQQVKEAADRKRAERGGFTERLWLEEVYLT